MATRKTGTFKEIPAQKLEIEQVFCDMCGKDIPDDKPGYSTFVEVEASRYWTDGHDGTTEFEESYDVCLECFREKLVPFIVSGGKSLEKKAVNNGYYTKRGSWNQVNPRAKQD